MEGYRSLRRPGLVAGILLGLNAAVVLVSLPSAWMQLELLERIELGTHTDAELASNDLREQLLGFVELGLYLGTGLAFLSWYRRAYANLSVFGHARQHGTGWAVGAWIVPIVNLIRPYQMTREIWNASDPSPNEESAAGIESNPPLLIGWWATWIACNVIGQVEFRLSLNAETVHSLRVATLTQMGSDLATFVSAPLALLVVREITRRQEALHEKLAGAGLSSEELDGLQDVFR